MEDGVRSGGPSGVLVKTRNSSGCLIVRKKEDGLGGAGSSASRLLHAKKEKKRPRLVLSDSGSSDEVLLPHRRRVDPETIRVCNGLNSFEKDDMDETGSIRKKDRLQYVKRNDDVLLNRMDVDGLGRNMGTLDVFDFNEYDDLDGEIEQRKHVNGSGEKRFLGSMNLPQREIKREFGTTSSRHALVDKRKNLYAEKTNTFDRDRPTRKINFDTDSDGAYVPTPLLRDKFRGHSDEAIRVQGKNGVLKVMVKKKKNVSETSDMYDHRKLEESRKTLRTEDTPKRKVLVAPSVYPETKPHVKQNPFPKPEKDHADFQTSASTKNGKGCSWDSGDSGVSLKPRKKVVEAQKSTKRASSEVEKIPCEETPPSTAKEGKAKRGSGTEKQKLRERIRGMLLSSGWKIDYRPRRNRDYLDAVYVNPTGTAYWSIIKAYDALQKQLNEEGAEAKPSADASFTPISDDILSQLTRKTRKKIEKEWKSKQRDESDSENAKEASALRSAGTKNDVDSMDSDSNEEKLSSFIKQGGKSIKKKLNDNGFPSVDSKGQSSSKYSRDANAKHSSGFSSRILHGRKGRKLGLLVRRSSKGLDSENDGFVPYTGKRTLLSWLIDSGTVQLSQKVRYMNRRQTRVMLEGWITRDGIHCGCCSKILTVSKFEIHAGSKLRQPFQNIFLESGISLLQCQIDAWNRQEESKRLSFHTFEIEGDDPNDDTCGICGDGGDLICCDGCPSTFHQSCLDIQIPPGDWHCPNCTCKYCGVASVDTSHENTTNVLEISSCMLCEKKFHESCIPEMDTHSNGSVTSFCGKNCRELFENLQKFLGVKHELDAGFSWSLVRRTSEDSDSSHRGHSQRIECNSKLAVALTVMDECFLSIVDRRSGINLIHNVLYNIGSNFYRLNYSGFYTAILERGDEIISAATIRFHGTKLAEMPFIGTRHIYRRQGMCRRLFRAIESALRLLKVEKLIIPAIAELMHTWNVIFGFIPLEQSLKQEMRLMNMLVFPGTDMLQKLLIEETIVEENATTASGAKQTNCRSTEFSSPKMDAETSSGQEPQSCDDTEQRHSKKTTNEAADTNPDPESMPGSPNDTSVVNSSLDASREVKTSCFPMETENSDSDSGDKLAECSPDGKCSSPSNPMGISLPTKNRPGIQHVSEDHSQSTSQCMAADTPSDSLLEPKVTVSDEGIIRSNSHAGHKLVESDSQKKSFPSTLGHGTDEFENNIPVMDSPEYDKCSNKINGHDFREDNAHANSFKPALWDENFANGVVGEKPLVSSSGLCGSNGRPSETISDDGICGSENSPQTCGEKVR
ncbi:increased DNA methylation 1-like [Cucurbita maxima]|uniref:Increased DNA methylation 1-like n=1 Tax=Cucurbita maxima TaxID=3661 RepID=A0A6J1KEI5_CUCMA|nr:increased DNA methylation 1-like [Cucurbita maxima]